VQGDVPPTPHCDAKSAQAVDSKGVGSVLLCKRVRNSMKRKGIEELRSFDEGGARGETLWLTCRALPKVRANVLEN